MEEVPRWAWVVQPRPAQPSMLCLGSSCSCSKVGSLQIMKFNKLYTQTFHLYTAQFH